MDFVGAASRENASKTVWDAVRNTTLTGYAQNTTNNPHEYLLDGGIAYRTTYNGQHFAVGTHGRGGKGAYAFNIGGVQHHDSSIKVGIDASQSSWASTVPLFETANKAFAANNSDNNTWTANQKYGYTVGTASILRVATARSTDKLPIYNNTNSPIRYVAAVNNGYGSSDGLPALYLYDAIGQGMTYTLDSNGSVAKANPPTYNSNNVGKLLAKIVVPSTSEATTASTVTTDDNSTLANGLSAPALVDTNLDGLADVAYAGDLNGNMYRFDLRGKSPSEWTAYRIFKGNSKRPIIAAPAVYRQSNSKIIVMFGTGVDLFTADLNDKTNQNFFGIYDDLEKTWVPSSNTTSNCTVDTATCQYEIDFSADSNNDGVIDNLTKQTLSQTTSGSTTYRILTSNALGSNRGWYIPLSIDTGERVTVEPTVVDNSVYFTTRIYQTNSSSAASKVCSVTSNNGYSWVVGASVLTGGALSDYTSNLGQVEDIGFIAGYQLNSLSSGTAYVSSVADKTNAADEQGKAQNGQDNDLTDKSPNGSASQNYCGNTSSGELTYATTDEGVQNLKVYNRRCTAVIKRLSWHEIF